MTTLCGSSANVFGKKKGNSTGHATVMKIENVRGREFDNYYETLTNILMNSSNIEYFSLRTISEPMKLGAPMAIETREIFG